IALGWRVPAPTQGEKCERLDNPERVASKSRELESCRQRYGAFALDRIRSVCKFRSLASLRIGENSMSSVRVLVGTKKGAFILTSDGKGKKGDVSGPLLGGWEMSH